MASLGKLKLMANFLLDLGYGFKRLFSSREMLHLSTKFHTSTSNLKVGALTLKFSRWRLWAILPHLNTNPISDSKFCHSWWMCKVLWGFNHSKHLKKLKLGGTIELALILFTKTIGSSHFQCQKLLDSVGPEKTMDNNYGATDVWKM